MGIYAVASSRSLLLGLLRCSVWGSWTMTRSRCTPCGTWCDDPRANSSAVVGAQSSCGSAPPCRLAAVEPVPDVILIDSELSDDSGREVPLTREASQAGAAVDVSASGVEGGGAVRSDADGSHGSRAVVPKETLLLEGEGRSGGYCGAWPRRRSTMLTMLMGPPFRQW